MTPTRPAFLRRPPEARGHSWQPREKLPNPSGKRRGLLTLPLAQPYPGDRRPDVPTPPHRTPRRSPGSARAPSPVRGPASCDAPGRRPVRRARHLRGGRPRLRTVPRAAGRLRSGARRGGGSRGPRRGVRGARPLSRSRGDEARGPQPLLGGRRPARGGGADGVPARGHPSPRPAQKKKKKNTIRNFDEDCIKITNHLGIFTTLNLSL